MFSRFFYLRKLVSFNIEIGNIPANGCICGFLRLPTTFARNKFMFLLHKSLKWLNSTKKSNFKPFNLEIFNFVIFLKFIS